MKPNKLIIFRAMRRGKKVFPVTIALTEEEIEWLGKQPNASAIIRKVLDDLIILGQTAESKMGAVSLNWQIGELEKKREQLVEERNNFLREKDGCWQKHQLEGYYHPTIVWIDKERCVPKPLDNEDAKVAFKVLQNYNEGIILLEQRISEIKKKILET